ncbi:MAG: hypothetical protein V7742_11340 [Halioglobus sp.]
MSSDTKYDDFLFTPDLYCNDQQVKNSIDEFLTSPTCESMRPKRGDPAPFRESVEVLIYNLLVAGDDEVAIPMGREAYSKSRYNKRSLSDRFTNRVRELAKAGLLKLREGSCGERRRTTVRASQELAGLIEVLRPFVYAIENRSETIELRSKGQLVDYHELPETCCWREALGAYNELLASTAIVIPGNAGLYELNRPLHFRRVFNRSSFECGGRIYCHTIQNLKQTTRKSIQIDGQAVVEPDFKGQHPRMLYLLEGVGFPSDKDIYGFWEGATVSEELLSQGEVRLRALAKAVLLRSINASGRRGACESVKSDEGVTYPSARALYDAMCEYHQPIAGHFSSGLGIRLQRADSDIMLLLLAELTQRGIVGLPVHDSIIVAAGHMEVASSLMALSSSFYLGEALPIDLPTINKAGERLSSDLYHSELKVAEGVDEPLGLYRLRQPPTTYIKEDEVGLMKRRRRVADWEMVEAL